MGEDRCYQEEQQVLQQLVLLPACIFGSLTSPPSPRHPSRPPPCRASCLATSCCGPPWSRSPTVTAPLLLAAPPTMPLPLAPATERRT